MASIKQWVIMGDYEKVGPALVCVLPRGCDKGYADGVLARLTLNPSRADRIMVGEANSLWAEEIDIEDAWWND